VKSLGAIESRLAGFNKNCEEDFDDLRQRKEKSILKYNDAKMTLTVSWQVVRDEGKEVEEVSVVKKRVRKGGKKRGGRTGKQAQGGDGMNEPRTKN
jgi:hypothetical protein